MDAGSDSKNSNGSPVGGWLSVTGNLPGDQLKPTRRSYTIKKGDSRILVVSTGSVSLLVTNQEGEVANPKRGMEPLMNADFQELTEETRTEHLDYCDSVYVDPS